MHHSAKDNYVHLTTTPVPRLITSLAVPTIISMLVTSFYNMADTYFVGKINTQSTAAVGIVFSVMSIIQAVGFFFGHGSGNYISRKLGAQETESAEKMASTGFFFALFIGAALAVLGLLFLTPLSLALGSTPTILPYTERYLGIILLGTPFMTASLVLNNQIRFQGNAAYAMVGIVSGAVINVVLDPILIFVCDMGISGAALATVVSQICSFILLLYMGRRGGNIRIRYRNFTPTLAFIKEIIGGGTPSLTRQGLASVATILLNVAAGAYGDAAIAGMSIVTRISMFINAFLIGFGQGFQPVCGFNYGAGLYARVRQGFWFCVKVGFFFFAGLCGGRYGICRGDCLHLPQGRPCCCSYRCGSIALAVHHLSVGCMDCGQQHDAADYPQARTRYDTFLCPSRAVLHPPHLHSSLFLRTERGGDVPGGVGHADLLPRHSIDLRGAGGDEEEGGGTTATAAILKFLRPYSIFTGAIGCRFTLSRGAAWYSMRPKSICLKSMLLIVLLYMVR